jgi:tetratricopeptide (TPR) repeat protein
MANQYLTIMNRYLIALALCLFSIALAKAQNLDEEVEFNYIKAKYLLDTERYEDAITAFTKIITEHKEYKDALLLRAQSKYAMAAYQGTKKDVLLYVSTKGLTGMAATLLGKADYRMGRTEAAINSLSVAILFNKEDAQIPEYLGNLYEDSDQMLKACENWQLASNMGSSKARIKAKSVCGSSYTEENTRIEPQVTETNDKELPKAEQSEETPEEVRVMKDESTSNGDHSDDSLGKATRDKVIRNNDENKKDEQDDETTQDPITEDDEGNPIDDEPVVVEREKMPEEDNTPNEIEIDEDLTLVIRGQGLGKRKVLDQPNILILSDNDGIVSIDICVNKRGKVESAEFNSKLSTIAKKSLVSLAIRKSKDFWFEKNDFKEQCGVIMFKIKGS